VDIGNGYSSVVIQGNRLYATGYYRQKPTVHCLDATAGRALWRTSLQGIADFQSTPAVDGDRVYLVTKDGSLVCLQAANGKPMWQKDFKDDFGAPRPTVGWAASPVAEGDLLLLNANTKELALDKRSGDVKWVIDDKEPPGSWGSHATPVVRDFGGTRGVLFLGPSTLNAVEVTTGKKLWSYPHGDVMHPVADPIVAGREILVQFVYSCTLLQTAGRKPKVLWSSSELDTCLTAAVLVEGYLYGTHTPYAYTGRSTWGELGRPDWPLRCVDWKTGRLMWEKTMRHATLMAADGKLVILEVDGTLHIVEASPASYKELSSADVLRGAKKPRIFGTPPVLWGGMIYCRNFTGDLVCIDVSR
jgi:outer membrane protein assembly factor BamB